MGLWLFIQLFQWLAWTTLAQESDHGAHNMENYLEDFSGKLNEAALSVLRQHSAEEWSQPMIRDIHPDLSSDPPEFNMPDNFMHSYVPDTGVGNREELKIDTITSKPFYSEDMDKWSYIRFNSSDYVMGSHSKGVFLWRTRITDSTTLRLSTGKANYIYVPLPNARVLDSFLFTPNFKPTEELYLAILSEGRAATVNVFEIIGGDGNKITALQVAVIELLHNTATKLSYVQSQRGGSLVVLFADYKDDVIYQQKGSNPLNYYIEVHYPSAVDLVSFTISGHGYVAVANSTICDVLKMNEFVQSHISFDRLYLSGIRDLENFRLGFDHYLAIAGESDQVLYIWKRGGFFPKQEFHFSDARQWYSAFLPTCRDDVLLFLIKDAPEVFIWDGQKQKFLVAPNVIPKDFRPLEGTLTSFGYNRTAFLLFADSGFHDSRLYAIGTHLKSVPDPVLLVGREVAQIMKELQAMMKEQAEKMQLLSSVLKYAVRQKGDQHISVHQSFSSDFKASEATAEEFNLEDGMAWQGSDLTMEDFLLGTDELEDDVRKLEESIAQMSQLSEDVVLLNEDAVITGAKTFLGNIYGDSLSATSLHLENAAGVNIPQLQNDLYRLDQPKMISGHLTFSQPITITGDLSIEGTINGVDISEDVMTTNTKQISHAHMTFESKFTVAGNLDLSGTINGIDIGTELVTLSGNHTITGTKTFLDGIEAENVDASIVDGVDIGDFYRKAFTRSTDQYITGVKHFTGSLLTRNIDLEGKLNGYDISELAESLVRIDKPSVVTGKKIFEQDVSFLAELTVIGYLDNMKIPEDFVQPNKPKVITGVKNFTGVVKAVNVTVLGTVDGLHLPEDVITLTRNETVENTLIFLDGITVERDIEVGGLVDGVDISELAKQALKMDDTRLIENVTFQGPVTINSIDIKGTVNGVDLEELVKDIVFKDEKNVVIEAPKTFFKVTAQSVKLNKMINGYNIEEDFMLAKGNQTIYGVKTFKSPVTFQDLSTSNNMIDDVDIVKLYENRISLSAESNLEGKVEFIDHLIINGDLIVDGTIDGLKFPDDVVLRSTDQKIYNKVFENDFKVGSLSVGGDVTVSGTFCGVVLEDFVEERVTLSGDQDLHGDFTFGNTTAERVEVDFVNDLDIKEFAENIMSLTKDQVVTATKEFSGDVHFFGDVSTKKGINGINLKEVNEQAFKLHGDNIVTAPFTFIDTLTVMQNLTVEGLINGINLTHLNEDSLKTDGIQTVSGVNTFEKGFHVEGDIMAKMVNGIDLGMHILTKTRDQVIEGTYTFGNVSVEKDVNIDGMVNGIDLSELNQRVAKIDGSGVIKSNIVFESPVHVSGNVEVNGLVNGIDLKKLQEEAVFTTGDQIIPGEKIIKGSVEVYGDVEAALVNGENLMEFMEDIVFIDRPQTITGKKTFQFDFEVDGDVFVDGTVTVEGMINGIHLGRFLEEAVFLNQPANITGTKVFKSPVQITGNLMPETINGIRLREDVITLHCDIGEPQVITGSKTFSSLSVHGNITVAGLVNGYNLTELARDTLTIDGNQSVTGRKQIMSPVTFLGNIHADDVNGLDFDKQLVTLHTNQEISGKLTFQSIHIDNDLIVYSLINDVDVWEMARDAIYLDTAQTITGEFTLDHVVAEKGVIVEGTVNDLDLDVFDRNVTDFWDNVTSDLKYLRRASEDHCRISKYLHGVLEESYYALDGFVKYQDLESLADYIQVDTKEKRLNLVHLQDSEVMEIAAMASHHKWDDAQKEFLLENELHTNVLRRLIYPFGDKVLAINIAVPSEESSVTLNEMMLYSFRSGIKDACVVVLSEEEVFIAVLYISGSCEVFKVKSADSYPNPNLETLGNIDVGREATAVAMFTISKEIYLAFSCKFNPPTSKGSSLLYAWQDKEWRLLQKIIAPASSDVVHFKYHGYHYLAFADAVPVHEALGPNEIQVYRNLGHKEIPFRLFQRVPFDNAGSLEVFEFGGMSELYLAAVNRTTVQVFRLEGEAGFTSNYTICAEDITTVKPLLLDDDLFLVIGQGSEASQSSLVYKGLTKGSRLSPRRFEHCP